MRRLGIVLATLWVGCGPRADEKPAVGPPREAQRAPAEPGGEAATEKLVQLAVGLDAATADPDYASLKATLTALADALAHAPGDSERLAAAAATIRRQAASIGVDDEAPTARVTRAALVRALQAMPYVTPRGRRFEDAREASRRMVARIDEAAPLDQERDDVDAALRSLAWVMSEAVAVPLPEVRITGPGAAALLPHVEDLRRLAAKLSDDDREVARRTGRDILEELARAVSAAGGHAVEREATVLRLRAERLGDPEPLGLAEADHLKEALSAAVSALGIIAGNERSGSEWVSAAKVAVDGIDVKTPFGLQRGPVQDGLRAVVDAVAGLGQLGGPACHGGGSDGGGASEP